MIHLGYFSLLFALLASAWAGLGSMLGLVGRTRGLQRSAENAILASSALIMVAMGCLWYAFLTDDFRVNYVANYSSTSQPLGYKIGALWGGQSGSLLLWVAMLGAFSSVMVLQNRKKNRALMPYAVAVCAAVMSFFLILLNLVEGARPFETGPMRPDGAGLNPQLKTFWMMIHPPCLYLGYVAFTIPFAFAIGALATRRTGDIWFRTTRRWTLFAWFFLGLGILLGSYWAYVELGWGGYWAWDPVENASLMPWLVGTAFLHSVMIQEKKGMLKIWNMSLIILTFSLSIFGTFLTRSGIISSVHSFATSDIGPTFFGGLFSMALDTDGMTALRSGSMPDSWEPTLVGAIVLLLAMLASGGAALMGGKNRGPLTVMALLAFFLSMAFLFGFLPFVVFGALTLLILRLDSLKTEGRLESVLSRESSFLFNNMILVGMALVVLLLTMFPILSEAATGRKVTMGPGIFNLVNIPWALVLLFLSGVGPLIAWRKATAKNLRRSFIVPTLAGAWMLVLMLAIDFRAYGAAASEGFSRLTRFDVIGVFDQIQIFYPAITFALAAFVIGTVGLEYFRGTRSRMRQYGQSLPAAAGTLLWRNKRRYGGYIVHVGIVLIFIGVAGSSAYKTEQVVTMMPGQVEQIGKYEMRYDGYRLEAVDDHFGSISELTIGHNGRVIGPVEAEQRWHPNLMFPELRQSFLQAKQLQERGSDETHEAVLGLFSLIDRLQQVARREVTVPSTEVGINKSVSPLSPSRMGEDFYVIQAGLDPVSGRANFRIFINPMVNFIWIGGLVFMIGAHICVLPDSRERRRLESAMNAEDEERAVA